MFRIVSLSPRRKTFSVEADPKLIPPVNPYASSDASVEYFWLCSRCAEFMALRLGQDGTVLLFPPRLAHRNPEDFAIISRHKDRLLRSVNFAPKERRGH